MNYIEKVIVIIYVKEGQDISSDKLKDFIYTDKDLSNKEIINYYANRCIIENYFKTTKVNLDFPGYQVKARKALD